MILVAAGGFALYQTTFKPQVRPAPVVAVARLVKASAGALERSIRVSGQTSARRAASITVPLIRGSEARGTITLLELAKPGSLVKEGEVIARIDAQSVQDHVDDIADTIQQAAADVRKREAEQAVQWQDLQQTLKVAKANFDKARLDFQAAEVRTDIERELLKLAVDETEARYQQLQNDLAHRKAAHQAELKILKFTEQRHVRHLQRHQHDLDRFTMRAPMDGLVVLQTSFRGGEMKQVQLGDLVAPGQPIMKIVDPRSMQVEAMVNQAASSEIRIGQPAKVGVDAFPGLAMKGRVYSIGALAVGGWRQNYYIRNVPLCIAIEGFDPRVIPDMSAWGDVLLEKAANATEVPLTAVREENGRPFLFVRSGEDFEKRAVTLGLRNHTHVTVLAGLSAGEEVKLN